ncbi:MAG: glucose-1-phosphate adenylyltransferase [Actinomycetota bacterium]|nr:glucose-1-phosphate adenylyltransferase [Actinomycetota bacterium]
MTTNRRPPRTDPRVLSLVLAGGEGKRLAPLTARRAKPAVPFGGHYRLVDFVLSNLANAGYLKIIVLTQYKSNSLNLHITRTWRLSTLLGGYVSPVPAQMRSGRRWFAGSADAIFQNLELIDEEGPDHICVFGADHVYRMDPRQMVEQHMDSGAGVTVAGVRVPLELASASGVIEPGEGTRIDRFTEKPPEAEGLPDDPDRIFASMGNYVFSTETLVDAVTSDNVDDDSEHDVGGNIIPMLVDKGVAHVYDFTANQVPGETERDHGYWRDVGTLDAFYDAHMDLLSSEPAFNLHNQRWPIYTSAPTSAPATFLRGAEGTGRVIDSMVCSGAMVVGASVTGSVVSAGVVVEPDACVERSVVMHDVVVGRGSVVRNAIIDKNVKIPPGSAIGVDPDADRQRFTVTESGVVVIGKGEKVPPPDDS